MTTVERGPGLREVIREAASITELRHSAYGLAPLLMLSLVDFVQAFDNAIYGVLLPEIRRDLGVSLSALAVAGSVVTLLTISLGPGIGWLSDRTRRVHLVAASAVLSGAFSALTGLGRTLPHLTAARAIDEGSEGLGNIPTSSLLADYYEVPMRGRVYAFRSVASRAAQVVAPVTTGALAVWLGWRAPFFVFGPFVALSGVATLVVLREPVRGYFERLHLGADEAVARAAEAPPSFAEGLRAILANRTLKRVWLASTLATIGSSWFSFAFGLYLLEGLHLDPLQRSALALPGSIVGVVAAFVGGGLVDVLIRRRPGRMLTLLGSLQLFGAVSLLLMAVVPSIPLVIALSVTSAAFSGLVLPAAATLFSLIVPARLRGQGFGILGLSSIPALVLGPVGAGIATAYGLQAEMVAAVPLVVAAALVQMSAAAYFDGDMRAALAASLAAQEHERARAAGGGKLVVARGLDVSYGSVQVLFGVDVDIADGEILALLGTNGAGKSTLLRSITGLQPSTGGAVLFEGRDITHLPPHEIARLGIAFMPGGRGVFPGLTVQENLEMARRSCPPGSWLQRLEEVAALFPVVSEHARDQAGLLSGGEQQMVALAQAFLTRPRLLLIDELSLGLSPVTVARLLDAVRMIRDAGTTVVLVEQSVNVALSIADRAIFMEKGEVRFEGQAGDLLARPDLLRAVYTRGAAVGVGSITRPAPSTGRALLEVRGITKHFGGRIALDGVDLVLHDDEAIGLIGPNGAGKTTFFDVLSGFVAPDAGTVVLDGVDITGATPEARAQVGLIRRFQDARLFPSLTVFEALCVALERRLEVRNTFILALQPPIARRSERAARGRADRLLELFALGDHRDKQVAELSTGLRRLVDLACVLATEPRVLLLDEPSSGIAQAEAEALAPVLRRVRTETGCSLLLIEHDMPLITSATDELVGMVQGRVVVQGAADEVLTHPTLVEAYLGEREETIKRQGALR